MNIELLERVKQHILEEPRRLEMGDWARRSSDAPCGTQACIAGWACILTGNAKLIDGTYYSFGNQKEYASPSSVGMKVLELDLLEADRLFYAGSSSEDDDDVYGWPEDLSNAYDDAVTAEERAQITATRIDRFIATGGTE